MTKSHRWNSLSTQVEWNEELKDLVCTECKKPREDHFPGKVFIVNIGAGDYPPEGMMWPAQIRIRLGFSPGFWIGTKRGWRRWL